MKKLLFISLLFLNLFGLGQSVFTLQDLVETSMKNNFDIKISKLNEQKAEEQNTLGMAGFLPSINITATEQWSNSERDNPTSFVNGSIKSNQITPTISLQQTVFNGFQAQINRENYALLESMSQQNTELIVLNNLKAIYLSYYQIQAQHELIEYQQQILDLTLNLYNYNKQKWDVGIITKQELNTYYGFVLEDSLTLLGLTNQINNLNAQLAKVCGVEELTVQQTVLNKDLDLGMEISEVKNSLENNPNLRLAYLNQKIKDTELRKSKVGLYPTLTLNGGYNYNWSKTNLEGIGQVTGKTQDFYVGFSLNYNLFNGNKVKTGIKLSEINIESQELETQKIKQDLTIDLNRYIKNFTLLESQHNLSLRLLEVTKSTLTYWETKERAGIITSIDLRNYQKSYIINKQQELSQWLGAFQNKIEIQSLTTQLVDINKK